MSRKSLASLIIVAAIILVQFGSGGAVRAADAPPQYQLQFLGAGSPVALNNNGVVPQAYFPRT